MTPPPKGDIATFFYRFFLYRGSPKIKFQFLRFYLLDILLEDDDQDDKDVVGTEVSLISWGAMGGWGRGS